MKTFLPFRHLFKFSMLGLFLIGMVSSVFAQDNPKRPSELTDDQRKQMEQVLLNASIPFFMVEYDGSAATMARINQALNGNGYIRHEFQTIPYVSVAITASNVDNFVSNSLTSLDGVMAVGRETIHTINLDNSHAQTQALLAQEKGATGAGCGIAILDTGIDDRNCMFNGKLTKGSGCFGTDLFFGNFAPFGAYGYVPPCVGGVSSASTTDNSLAGTYRFFEWPADHGTHVAGIAAGAPCDLTDLFGSGSVTSSPGGVASGAHIIPVNVFSTLAWGPLHLDDGAFTGDIVAGLEWVFMNRADQGICAVNMSLGGGGPVSAPCNDATEAVINALTKAGIAVTIATGNDGFTTGVSSPACVESAIAVGAIDGAGARAGFSNHLDDMVDLMAPGVGIVSAVSDNIISTGVDGSGAFSGTSMAAPTVAGAFAILKARHPQATVAQMLDALQVTGAAVPGFSTPSIRILDACLHLDEVLKPIPTMSEWGLMIFGLLIMNMSVFFVRRKKDILAM